MARRPHRPLLRQLNDGLTANADPDDAAFYRRCGVNGVVEKPIRTELLLAAMNAVLSLVEPAAQEPAPVDRVIAAVA